MGDGALRNSLATRKNLPILMQSEGAECGLACIVMIGCYYGHKLDLASARSRFSTSLKGMTLARMVHIAGQLGMDARPIRAPLEYLHNIQNPCVLHWDLNHFVVLKAWNRKFAEIYDPARGILRFPVEEVSKHFTGVILELAPSSNFKPIVAKRRISLRSLTGRIQNLHKVVFQVLGLAVAIELLALVIPFFTQVVVDRVLITSDIQLLLILCVGFLVVLVIQTALMVARSWIVSWFSATLDAQWVTNLFGHLMQLPLSFFEKRHMGDIISRFGSLRTVQTTLTGSFVETMIDGVMGVLALGILATYSIDLTAIVLGGVILYTLARWAMFTKLRQLIEEKLIYGAQQQSELMESVRGVQAVKLANKQAERRARLANAAIESSSREMRAQRITLAFSAFNKGLFGTQRIVLVAFSALLAIRGQFTAGMLIAFVAYSDQFVTKFSGLVDKAVELKMLGLHAERIADIALELPEENTNGTYSGPVPEPRLILSGIGFRYAQDEPWVLKDLSMCIDAGECVGISGPSGSGKTTLIKIIMGLVDPNLGTVQIDSIRVKDYGLSRYREMLAAVTQDDQLFAGTIAQNISFFDEDSDINKVMEAANVAAIHDDISRMPMGYESLVGDMGSSLSGGQKQRLLLARAIYRRPRILVLDEATSHLDNENAKRIDSHIRAMRITRVVVSHNLQTLSKTDRQIYLPDINHSNN